MLSVDDKTEKAHKYICIVIDAVLYVANCRQQPYKQIDAIA